MAQRYKIPIYISLFFPQSTIPYFTAIQTMQKKYIR